MGPRYFFNIYLKKNHKITNNSTTTSAREKINADFESLIFKIFFDVRLTLLKNKQILLNIISHRFLVTTKLFTVKEPHKKPETQQ